MSTTNKTNDFGTNPLGQLLKKQAIPASIGILVMAIYGIVDTIFVGKWVSTAAIGAITVVMPIQFLMSSVGMAIGVGGSSIISRAFGEENFEKANHTFANMVSMVALFAILFYIGGSLYMNEILDLFGTAGDVTQPATEYFNILLYGVPFLTIAMMTNSVIRAEGYPKFSMVVLIIPAVLNVILDPILIVYFDMGIEGAAWATSISFMACAAYTILFFFSKRSKLRFKAKQLIIKASIVSEIGSIGSITLVRQGAISILAIVLNNSLVDYGGDMALSVYGVVNRIAMFAFFPILGVTQGFLPIVGFNYGAKLYDRVSDIISLSIKWATIMAFALFVIIMVFTESIVSIFTNDAVLITDATYAMRWVFAATPLVAINMLMSGYYQAVGKVMPALFLSLSKQIIFLVPLVLILPLFWGLDGIWYSFVFADVFTALVSYYFYRVVKKKIAGHLAEREADIA